MKKNQLQESVHHFLHSLLIAALLLQSVAPAHALRPSQESPALRGILGRAIDAGLEELVVASESASNPLDWIRDPIWRSEIKQVFASARARQMTEGPLGFIPERVQECLSQRQDVEALVEWAAYRWAYLQSDPRAEGVPFHETLSSLLRSIVVPERLNEVELAARGLGIPIDAVPRNFSSRVAGMVVPMYALRSNRNHGIGDIADLRALVQWAGDRGLRRVQINPVYEDDHHDFSPYYTLTTVGGSPLYIALDELPEVLGSPEAVARLQERSQELERLRTSPVVDYAAVRQIKTEILKLAYEHFKNQVLPNNSQRAQEFRAYQQREQLWLPDYARFRAYAEQFRGGWQSFPPELQTRDPEAMAHWDEQLADSIQFFKYLQWVFDQQWTQMRQVAHQNGVLLIGDLPIYVDGDAIWKYPDCFDRNSRTGVPPDGYAIMGQPWGHFPYNWQAIEQDGFRLWLERFGWISQRFDDVRLDHFLAFHRHFQYPYVPNENQWLQDGQDIGGVVARLGTAWQDKYPTVPFPLTLVADSGQVPDSIRKAGLHLWAEGSDRSVDDVDHLEFMRLRWNVWAQGSYADFTPHELERVIRRVMQMLEGRWMEGPGDALMQQIQAIAYEHLAWIIPEDVGDDNVEAEALRKRSGFARTRPLVWGLEFFPPLWGTQQYHPDSVTMTTTHDTPTLVGALDRLVSDPARRTQLLNVAKALLQEGVLDRPVDSAMLDDPTNHPEAISLLHEALMLKAARSQGRYALFPYQDLFGLGDEAQATNPARPWRDRMPVAVEELSQDSPTAQKGDAMVRRLLDDVQVQRRLTPTDPSDSPVLLGMWPRLDLEDRVRTEEIRNQGEPARMWTVVAPAQSQTDIGKEPVVEMRIWSFDAKPESATSVPMRLYAALPDGSRLYSCQAVIAEPGEYVAVPRVRRGRTWFMPKVGYGDEPVLRIVPSKVQDLLQKDSPHLQSMLEDSLLRYKHLDPTERNASLIAKALVEVLETRNIRQFSRIVRLLSETVSDGLDKRPELEIGDLSAVFSDLFLRFRDAPDMIQRIYEFLVEAAVFDSRERGDAALDPRLVQTIGKVLRGSRVGELVVVAMQSQYSSTTGGEGLYVTEFAEAMADYGVPVCVMVPLMQANRDEVIAKLESAGSRLVSTGKQVMVRFDNRDGSREFAVVQLSEAKVGKVRYVYMENDTYLYQLDGDVLDPNKRSVYRPRRFHLASTSSEIQTELYESTQFSFRVARCVSAGALLAMKELNMRPMIVQANDGQCAYVPEFLEAGTDVDPQLSNLRLAPQLEHLQPVYVVHTAIPDYQLTDPGIVTFLMAMHPELSANNLSSLLSSPDRGPELIAEYKRFQEDVLRFGLGRPDLDENREALIDPNLNSMRINSLYTALRQAERNRWPVVTVSVGHWRDSMDPKHRGIFGELDGLFRRLNAAGLYHPVPNGIRQVELQRELFEAYFPGEGIPSFLEISDETVQRGLHRRIRDEVAPRQKRAIYERYFCPEADVGNRPELDPGRFLYTVISRVEPIKGHPMLVTVLWDEANPQELKPASLDFSGLPFFEARKGYGLVRDDIVALQAMATGKYKDAPAGTPRTLTALEVAVALMPKLDFLVVGKPADGDELDRALQEIARNPAVNRPGQWKRFAYPREALDPSDKEHYRNVYGGSDVIGQISLIESYGYVPREGAMAGTVRHLSDKGGLHDAFSGERQVPEGFSPYNPVEWVLSLRRLYHLRYDAPNGWDDLRLELLNQDNRWPTGRYAEIEAIYRRPPLAAPDFLAEALPVLDILGIYYQYQARARLNSSQLVDLLRVAGYSVGRAEQILVRGEEINVLTESVLPVLHHLRPPTGASSRAHAGLEEKATTVSTGAVHVVEAGPDMPAVAMLVSRLQPDPVVFVASGLEEQQMLVGAGFGGKNRTILQSDRFGGNREAIDAAVGVLYPGYTPVVYRAGDIPRQISELLSHYRLSISLDQAMQALQSFVDLGRSA